MFAELNSLLRLPVRMAAASRARSFHNRDPLKAQQAMLPWLISRATATFLGNSMVLPTLSACRLSACTGSIAARCRSVPTASSGTDISDPACRAGLTGKNWSCVT